MVQATVNGKTFEISSDENGHIVNGSLFQWDKVRISDGYFHLLYKKKSYTAEVVSMDRATKKFTFKINGSKYSVDLKNKFDLLLEKMGMNNVAAGKINNVKAPMPGLIIDLKVKVGDVVKSGDHLLILEAMKMENILKSQGDATIKTVKVKKGDTVEKGQVLMEF
ncbi:MAG: acetyl-CoA carboxylase biotin carboxyl carrier protein subunit [Bacteroidia bacterium]|nr:acetyl-CoA carboxylase biotin carboxyl carrier protein subunit [Bacteroidia bacterium]